MAAADGAASLATRGSAPVPTRAAAARCTCARSLEPGHHGGCRRHCAQLHAHTAADEDAVCVCGPEHDVTEAAGAAATDEEEEAGGWGTGDREAGGGDGTGTVGRGAAAAAFSIL